MDHHQRILLQYTERFAGGLVRLLATEFRTTLFEFLFGEVATSVGYPEFPEGRVGGGRRLSPTGKGAIQQVPNPTENEHPDEYHPDTP